MNSVSCPPDPAVIPSLIFNPIRDEDNPRYRGQCEVRVARGIGARYSIRHAASLFRAQRRCSLHEPQLPRTVVDLPYEAINRHDIDAAASTFTDDVEYHAQESQIVGSVSGD